MTFKLFLKNPMCKMSPCVRVKISCVKCLKQVREATFLTEVATHQVVCHELSP